MVAPRLRFPEFTSSWRPVVLSDLTSKISDGIHTTPVYTFSGRYFFINGTNLIDGKIAIDKNTKRVDDKEYSKYKKELNESTILMSINGTIGNLARYEGESVLLGKSASYINLNNDVARDFVYYYLHTPKVKNYYELELTGSTIRNLSLQSIKNLPVSIPDIIEQQKIANFLTSIDKKIVLIDKKIELLKQYKKAVMQKIFLQQVRFKDMSGQHYPNGHTRNLGDLVELSMGQSPSSRAYNGDGHGLYLIQGNADIIGRRTAPRYWTSEVTKVCNVGDIILTVRAPSGYVAISMHHACIGRGVSVIKPKRDIDKAYLFQFLLWFEPRWSGVEQGSTFMAINSDDIMSIKLWVPCETEQSKISDFLTAIDREIELEEDRLRQAMAFKKTLLQRMFV